MAEELTGIAPLRPLLARRPLGVISDIDGTLAPIVPNAEDARVTDRNRELLAGLLARGVKLAFVTGRALETARAMVGIPGAAFAANHGLSLWLDGTTDDPDSLREYTMSARDVLREVASLAQLGVVIEDKGPVLAFHYRNAPEQDAARQAILAAIAASPAARAFRLQEGRKIVELRPPLAADKGTAVSYLASRLGLAAIICLGDDTTDLDMFRAVAKLRRQGIPGACVAVKSAEADPLLLESADYWVSGVPAVEWLLEQLLTALPVSAS